MIDEEKGMIEAGVDLARPDRILQSIEILIDNTVKGTQKVRHLKTQMVGDPPKEPTPEDKSDRAAMIEPDNFMDNLETLLSQLQREQAYLEVEVNQLDSGLLH